MTMIIKYDIIIIVEFVFRETLLKKTVNYLKVIVSFSLLSIILFSCSNSQESKLVYTESNTIKQTVKEKEQDITWTQELEGDRLSQVINRRALKLSSSVPYSKEIYKISNYNQNPVYPSLADFGSLDTSNMGTAVKSKMEDFCKIFASKNYNEVDSYFSRKYIFNYIFFIKDFEEGWKKNFNKKLPSGEKHFNKWLFGEPFNGSEIIQIPVRFYSDYGTIDMTVFLSAVGNNEFYQITIDRWQKV